MKYGYWLCQLILLRCFTNILKESGKNFLVCLNLHNLHFTRCSGGNRMPKLMRPFLKVLLILPILAALPFTADAANILFTGNNIPVIAQALPQIDLSIGGESDDFSLAIQALILITVLSFGPAFITMMTSFTRIIVVFFFLRMGLGTQQSPPNQVLIGLALFLTIFIMMPTFDEVNEKAIQPYVNEEMTQMEALTEAAIPLKKFMIKQTRDQDLLFFMDLVEVESADSIESIPLYVVVPSYV